MRYILIVAFIFVAVLFGSSIIAKLVYGNDIKTYHLICFATGITGVVTYFMGIW